MKHRILAVLAALAVAASLAGAYSYYYADTFTSLDQSAWYVNVKHYDLSDDGFGASPNGLSALPAWLGSVISRYPIPDGTSDGEVKVTVAAAPYTANRAQAYVRATSNAITGDIVREDVPGGAFYAAELFTSPNTGHELQIGREKLRQIMMAAGLWRGRRQRVEKVHQWRPRRSCRGELVQWDTSEHDWLEGRGKSST